MTFGNSAIDALGALSLLVLFGLVALAGAPWSESASTQRHRGRRPRIARTRRRKRPAAVHDSISRLRALTPLEFEHYVADVFRAAGWTATVTPGGGDFGTDVVLTDGRIKVAVQAKRYAEGNRVGNQAVQQTVAGADYYRCDLAVIVTTSVFTDPAKEQAKRTRTPVLLINENSIFGMASSVRRFVDEERPLSLSVDQARVKGLGVRRRKRKL